MRDILLSSRPTFRQIILLQFFFDKDTSRLVDGRPFGDNPNFILATCAHERRLVGHFPGVVN